jgi:hypothetical protein
MDMTPIDLAINFLVLHWLYALSVFRGVLVIAH